MRFSDTPSYIDRAIPDDMCSNELPWVYLASFTILDTNLPRTPEMIAHELQASLYNEGGMNGFFQVVRIEGDKVWVILVREGCEVDYHNCYDPRNGHDGTHESAIAQCDGELREAMSDGNARQGIALLKFGRVTDRVLYTAGFTSPWSAPWEELLLAA